MRIEMNLKAVLSAVVLSVTLCMYAGEAVLKCKVVNKGDSEIFYLKSDDGFMSSDKITPVLGADSTFVVKVKGDDIQRVSVCVSQKGSVNLYLSPGRKYELTIDPTADRNFNYGKGFSRKNTDATEAVFGIIRNYYNYAMGMPTLGLRGDTVAASVDSKLQNYSDSVARLVACADKNLQKVLNAEANLMNALFFREISAGMKNPRRGVSRQELERWDSCQLVYMSRIDHDNVFNALSSNFEQIEMMRMYEQCDRSAWRSMSADERNRATFDWIKTNLKGRPAQYMLAQVIVGDSSRGVFSPGIAELYDEFVGLYPESPMIGALDAAVRENRKANLNASAEGIRFIDADTVASIAELLGRYRGRPLMVDIWATYCAPCRASFEHAKEIQEFADANDIALLYISVDEGEDAVEKSRKLARYYDLKGDHLTISPELKMEVYSTFGNERSILFIPAVAVFDKDGKRWEGEKINGEDVRSVLGALSAVVDRK